MNPIDWIILGIGAVATASVVALSFHPGHHEWLTSHFAYRAGLVIPPQNEAAVGRLLGLRERIVAVGAFLGAMAGWFASAPGYAGTDPDLQYLFVVTGFLAGVAVAVAISSRVFAIAPDPDRALYARSMSVGLRDYSAGFERNGTRMIVVLSVIALVTLVVVGGMADVPFTSFSTPVIPFVAAAVAGLALFEVRGRQIVSRGQRAASTSELAFDDAFRAREIADLVTAPLMFGVFGLTFAITELIVVVTGMPTDAVIRPLFLIVLAAAIVGGFVSRAIRPQQYYLRRLWPRGLETVPASSFENR